MKWPLRTEDFLHGQILGCMLGSLRKFGLIMPKIRLRCFLCKAFGVGWGLSDITYMSLSHPWVQSMLDTVTTDQLLPPFPWRSPATSSLWPFYCILSLSSYRHLTLTWDSLQCKHNCFANFFIPVLMMIFLAFRFPDGKFLKISAF